MKFFEFSFPGKFFDGTAIIQAYDNLEAQSILKWFIMTNPDFNDWDFILKNIKFVRELGQVSEKSELIYYFDGDY